MLGERLEGSLVCRAEEKLLHGRVDLLQSASIPVSVPINRLNRGMTSRSWQPPK